MTTPRITPPHPDKIALPPGRIVQPIAGTTRWDRKGRALGVWGVDFPARLHVEISPGDLRPLTDAEERLARRIGYL
jgi:hypothetical protein